MIGLDLLLIEEVHQPIFSALERAPSHGVLESKTLLFCHLRRLNILQQQKLHVKEFG